MFNINLIKHGDRSKVNSLNKAKGLFRSSEQITESIISFKYDNFLFIVGFITFLLPIYSSLTIFRCS